MSGVLNGGRSVPEFLAEFGNPERRHIRILLTCNFPIHRDAMAIIQTYQDLAASQGFQLLVANNPS